MKQYYIIDNIAGTFASFWMPKAQGRTSAEAVKLGEGHLGSGGYRMKTLVIRHFTGPLFRGGTEFGWREDAAGPIDWFNNTGLNEVEIQRQLQEYRKVCGFEFEVEDQRQAGEHITTEPCPTCRAPATCRHLSGTHVWDCPNCGEIIATACYECLDCAVGVKIKADSHPCP